MVPPDTIEALTRAGATGGRLLEAVLDQEKVVRGRPENPRGCRELAEFLEPWPR